MVAPLQSHDYYYLPGQNYHRSGGPVFSNFLKTHPGLAVAGLVGGFGLAFMVFYLLPTNQQLEHEPPART